MPRAGNVNPQMPVRTLPGLPQVKLEAVYDSVMTNFILTDQIIWHGCFNYRTEPIFPFRKPLASCW